MLSFISIIIFIKGDIFVLERHKIFRKVIIISGYITHRVLSLFESIFTFKAT